MPLSQFPHGWSFRAVQQWQHDAMLENVEVNRLVGFPGVLFHLAQNACHQYDRPGAVEQGFRCLAVERFDERSRGFG